MPAIIGLAAKAAMVGSVALAPSPAHNNVITVKHGDTLSSLAVKNNVPGGWTSLYMRNRKVVGSDPDFIVPGEKLVKPATAIATTAVVTSDKVTVKPNESLTEIAQAHNTPGGWDSIYAANKELSDPNVLEVGQVLTLPDHAESRSYSPPVQQPAPVAQSQTDSQQPAPVQQQAAPVQQAQSSAPVHGNSSFQDCVISRESGGNPNVMNSSGHYGLYQFSEQTWVAYGGSASDFGNASAAEQTRVFNNAMATPGGGSNWSPYDGC